MSPSCSDEEHDQVGWETIAWRLCLRLDMQRLTCNDMSHQNVSAYKASDVPRPKQLKAAFILHHSPYQTTLHLFEHRRTQH